MLPLQLPGRPTLRLTPDEAAALYEELWANPTRRGAVTAAARIRQALQFGALRSQPLLFDSHEADAVSEALERLG